MVTPLNSSERDIDSWTRQAYFQDLDEEKFKYEYHHLGIIKWVLTDYEHHQKSNSSNLQDKGISSLDFEAFVPSSTQYSEGLKRLSIKSLPATDSEDSNQKSNKKQLDLQESSSRLDLKIPVPSSTQYCEGLKQLSIKSLPATDSEDSNQKSKRKQSDLQESSTHLVKILVPSRLNEMISNSIKTDMVRKNEGTSVLRRTSQRIINNREKRRSQCENNDPKKRMKSGDLTIQPISKPLCIDPNLKINGIGAAFGDSMSGTNPLITKPANRKPVATEPVTLSGPKISANDPRLKRKIACHVEDSKFVSQANRPTASLSNIKNNISAEEIFAKGSIVRSRSFNSAIYAAKTLNKSKTPDLVIKNVEDCSRNLQIVECNTNIKGDINKVTQQKTVKVLLPKRRCEEEVPVIQQTETSQSSKNCKVDDVKENRDQAIVKTGKNCVKKMSLSKSKHNNKKSEKIVKKFLSQSLNESKVLAQEKLKTETGVHNNSLQKKTMVSYEINCDKNHVQKETTISEINNDKNGLKMVISIGKNRIEPNILKKIKEIKSDLTDETVEKPPQITSENQNLSKTRNNVENKPFSDDIESDLAALNGIDSDDKVCNNDVIILNDNKIVNESVFENNSEKNVSVQNEQKTFGSTEKMSADETQKNPSVLKDKCQKPGQPECDINQNVLTSQTKNVHSITTLGEAVVTALTRTIDVNSNNSQNSFEVTDILNHGNSISINGESFYLVKVPVKSNNCVIDNTTPRNLLIPKYTDSRNSICTDKVEDNKICNNLSQNINETDNNSDRSINHSVNRKNFVPDHISQLRSISVVEPVKNNDIEHTKPAASCNNLQKKEKSVPGNKEPVIEIDLTEDLFPEITDQFCNSFSSRTVKQECGESSLQDVSEDTVKEKFNENFNNLYKYMNIKKEECDDDVIFVKEINSSLAHKEEETLDELFKEFAEIFQFFCFARGTKHCFEALQRVGIDNGSFVQFSLLQRDLPDQIDLNIKKGTKVIQNIKSVISDISWSPENIRRKIILPVYSIIIEKKPEVSLKTFEDFFFAFLKAKERNKLLESHKFTINPSFAGGNQRNNENGSNTIIDNSQTPCINTRPLVYCIPTDRLKSQSAEIFPQSAASEQGIPVCKPTCQPRTIAEPETYKCSQSSQPKVNLLPQNDFIINQLSVPWSNCNNAHQLPPVRALDKGKSQSQQQFYPRSYHPPVRPPCIPCNSFPIRYPPPPYPSLIAPLPYMPSHPSNQVNSHSSKNKETLKTASNRRNSSDTQKNHDNAHAGFLQRQLHAESPADASMQFDNRLSIRTNGNSKPTCPQKNTVNTRSLNTTNFLNQSLGQNNNISDLTSSAIERSTFLHSLHQNGTSLSTISRSERNITSYIHNSKTPKDLTIMRKTSHHLSNFQKQAESDIFPCAVCTNLATLMCSNCCSIAYCSEICATKDWKKQHFQVCQKLQRTNNFNSDKIQE